MQTKLGRRDILGAAGGAALALPACFSHLRGGPAQEIRIGYVTPLTGFLSAFGAADVFVVERVRAALNAAELRVGGKRAVFQIEMIDSQSDADRASAAASKLVHQDKVDLMVVAHTPQTTNPVSAVTELAHLPCIAAVVPVDPWLAEGPYPSTFLLFWDLSAVSKVFTGMWNTLPTNKVVAGLWPDDADGRTCAEHFTKALPAAGFRLVDGGRYANGTTDFRPMIRQWAKEGCEILTGVPIPPDWPVAWRQCRELGFSPKVATIGKAILFPQAVEALGPELANGLTTEVWWSPQHPYRSQLTGETPQSLCAAYPRQWTQPLGFTYALFEVAAAAVIEAGTTEPVAVVNALGRLKLSTIVGSIAFDADHVARTELVGGQWGKGKSYSNDLEIVFNQTAPQIPKSSTLKSLGT